MQRIVDEYEASGYYFINLLFITPGVLGLDTCGHMLLSSDWEVEIFVEELRCELLYLGRAVGVWLPLS